MDTIDTNEPSWMKGPPRCILIATDLSPRCDRAFDRAAALARHWHARLIVLHVVEGFATGDPALPSWRRPPDAASAARKRILADLSSAPRNAAVLIEHGNPADVILRVAKAEGCDLVVTGVARSELFGRFSLGRTVEHLLRHSRVPVLIVKDRMRGMYHHIVVGTDFSPSSRHALEAAAHFFPHQRLTLFHAYDLPYEGLGGADSGQHDRTYKRSVQKDYRAFLEGVTKPPRNWQEPRLLVEEGAPDHLLQGYAHDKGVDLVVLGTHGRHALFEMLLGSVAKEVVDALPCDALVVREPRAAA
jgi:nucleotide-binding universal stress UspA family protein